MFPWSRRRREGGGILMVWEEGGERTSKHASLPKVKENAVCLFGGIARSLGGEFEAEGVKTLRAT